MWIVHGRRERRGTSRRTVSPPSSWRPSSKSRAGGYPDRVLAFLAVTQVLIVVALTTTILMHSGRDAGMGGMGFTPASQGGTHIVERNLTRVTLVLAVLFFANSIALFHFLKYGCKRRWQSRRHAAAELGG